MKPTAARSTPQAKIFHFDTRDEWTLFQFPYDPALVDHLKRTTIATDRRWDPKRKLWRVRRDSVAVFRTLLGRVLDPCALCEHNLPCLRLENL